MAKSALCIGINNYPGTQLDLAGCVNDANDWAAELGARGFSVTQLIDSQATKAAMVKALKTLVGGAASGDTLVITFSGHGTFVPDADGDEEDGLDEALCPYDIQTGAGPLIDDEIHALFSARQPDVKLVFISDSCHSGTVNRAAAAADPKRPRPRFMPMANWSRAAPAAARPAPRSGVSPFKEVLTNEGDLLLSGCREGATNLSYDATFKDRPNGAFTYHALRALRDLSARKPGATYADWIAAVTPDKLPTPDCPQEPQIVGSAAARGSRIFD